MAEIFCFILPPSANQRFPSSTPCTALPFQWSEQRDLCFAVQCWRKSSNDIQFSIKRRKKKENFMKISIRSFSPKTKRKEIEELRKENLIYFSFNHKEKLLEEKISPNFPFLLQTFDWENAIESSKEVTSVFLSFSFLPLYIKRELFLRFPFDEWQGKKEKSAERFRKSLITSFLFWQYISEKFTNPICILYLIKLFVSFKRFSQMQAILLPVFKFPIFITVNRISKAKLFKRNQIKKRKRT